MPLLSVERLVKDFPRRRGLFRAASTLRAVDHVSFAIEKGEIFGLVGESGSGKTTTGRCILRLLEPSSGTVTFGGRDLLSLPAGELRRARREMQMVFQDPYASLNPRMRVGQIIAEPLVIHAIGSRNDREARVRDLLALVGLEPAHADRYPREFSGGQRQRISIARALALNPSFIVADEPVSSLDVSVQAQVVNLLADLHQALGLTYLFIAHDLRLVRHLCMRAAVMYRGRIVEMGPTSVLFEAPVHPYTRALLAAVPAIDPESRRERMQVEPTAFDPALPLREIERGHLAAV